MARWLPSNSKTHAVFGVLVLAVLGALVLTQLYELAKRQGMLPSGQSTPWHPIAEFAFEPFEKDSQLIEKDSHLIFLPGTIGSVSGSFIFDTGASHHVLDRRHEPLLGKRISSEPANTSDVPITVDVFNAPNLHIGPLAINRDTPVVVSELAHISAALGRDVDGILGAPFLRDRVITLDFDRGVMRVVHSADATPGSWGVPLQLRVDSNGLPHLPEVTVGTETMSFLIDTGMTASISLATSEFERLASQGVITDLDTSHSETASGKVDARWGRIETIRLGPFEHHSVRVIEARLNTIGIAFLSRFQVTLDVTRRRMYLTPRDLGANEISEPVSTD